MNVCVRWYERLSEARRGYRRDEQAKHYNSLALSHARTSRSSARTTTFRWRWD